MTTNKISLGVRKVSWAKKQTVIPEAVLEALELEEGDSIHFYLVDAIIVLEKEKP